MAPSAGVVIARAGGAVVSTVTPTTVDAVLPTTALIGCSPWASDGLWKLQAPLASAVAEPSIADPSRTLTVLPAGAVPDKLGVLSDVMPSVAERPVSLALSSLTVGTAGLPREIKLCM